MLFKPIQPLSADQFFNKLLDFQVTIAEKGAGMGDKGGKKDKDKNKQQQLTKQKQDEQKKHDKAPAKKP
jgi:hypothetical protein